MPPRRAALAPDPQPLDSHPGRPAVVRTAGAPAGPGQEVFCDEPSCERKIFAERLDEAARLFSRGTDRRREALEWIGLAQGGEAAARLARELGLLVSPDILLNRIRGLPAEA